MFKKLSLHDMKTILAQPPLLRNWLYICICTTAHNCSQNPFTDYIRTHQENIQTLGLSRLGCKKSYAVNIIVYVMPTIR